jgi:hypothetical protein
MKLTTIGGLAGILIGAVGTIAFFANLISSGGDFKSSISLLIINLAGIILICLSQIFETTNRELKKAYRIEIIGTTVVALGIVAIDTSMNASMLMMFSGAGMALIGLWMEWRNDKTAINK